MVVRKDTTGMNVEGLLFNHSFVPNRQANFHGLVGTIKPYKTTYNIVVLSGGGIDSFMSTYYALNLIDKINVQADIDADDDTDSPDFQINLHFMLVDYGQANFEAERRMTNQQAAFFSKRRIVNSSEVVEVTDGLVKLIRNPLGNREIEKKSAKEAGINYAANDDYVPNRNARFVFTAAGYGETIGADLIVLGAVGNVNQDNSLIFMQHAYNTIKQSNRDHFPALYAPFVLFSKSMVAIAAMQSGMYKHLPFLSTSCFDSNAIFAPNDSKKSSSQRYAEIFKVKQCGVCRSCSSLKQAFKFAGIKDPYDYDETLAVKAEIEEITAKVAAESSAKTLQSIAGPAPGTANKIKVLSNKIEPKKSAATLKKEYLEEDIFDEDDEDDED